MSNNTLLEKLVLKVFSENKKVEHLTSKIKLHNLSSIFGMSTSLKALFAFYLTQNINRPIVFVTSNISQALSFKAKLELLGCESVEYLEQQESSPYQLIYSDTKILNEELNCLRKFESKQTNILVITARSLLNLYPSKNFYKNYSINLAKNEDVDPYKLAQSFVELGYRRAGMVTDTGEFSIRGDILDIFPMTDMPVRIEFWGDRIESIRYFNPETQRTIKHLDKISIDPCYKVVISKDKIEEFKLKLEENYNRRINELEEPSSTTLSIHIESILENLGSGENYFEGVEYYAPLLDEGFSSILDYLPSDSLIIYDESHEVFSKTELQHSKYLKEYSEQVNEGFTLSLPQLLHFNFDELEKELKTVQTLSLNSFAEDEDSIETSLNFTPLPKFSANESEIANYIASLRSSGKKIIITTEYPKRIYEILHTFECPAVLASDGSLELIKAFDSKDIIIIKSGMTEGFISEDLDFAIITDTELFNRKLKKPTITKKLSHREDIDSIESIKELKTGDYVVHLAHGIGKYLGLNKQEVDGQEKDYLLLEYSNGDKLYMPAEQINLLSRYRGSGSTPPKLSRMGGADWNNVKSKVKKAIEDIAEDLLILYAKRAKKEGYSFDVDSPWQLEMEDAFPYTETPDQMRAINETKADMESPYPTDRLICGDVGFGKTEVAIRAVFKAVMSGKQVALLVPTTILAQQHFNTFSERFKPYPAKIELLSRFKKPKEQKETLKRMLTGDCDVVIGTHKLLQKDVEFKNLGLIVIDEEHRFGVSHKEKLKQLRAEVDVISLSATPIPRTLYMSLSGIRNMSLINTPPVNRAPIKTFVGAYNESFVKTAVNHELEREGQVYFLYNRVQSIYKFAHDLQELLPNARIAVAHGQMKEKELEQIIYDFSVHNYDILVCTTIIESGLDIPNANTILVYDADKFGLAQLYQIRGRVGRSDRQAYAYCFYKKDKELTPEATDRLKAIKDFTTLGSGYQIAMRDLEIRGVGNLLGAQQHGHMISVGFDMYCSLLEDTIKEFQGEKVSKKDPPIIDINITAFIPDDWVGDKNQKMIEYKRLADVATIRELELITDEWVDRFGKIPDTVKPLIKIIKLRLFASTIGISLIRETSDEIRIYTEYNLGELEKIKKCLPDEIVKRLKWKKAPITAEHYSSLILLNNFGLTSEELLNMLEDLFYYIIELQKAIT